MLRRLSQTFVLLLGIACCGRIAFAGSYGIASLSYDSISASDNEFDITNLTGTNSFPCCGFPITTLLSFTVTSLVVDFSSGPALILPGSDFTVVDSGGDEDCTPGACNLFGDNITSATLTGTISPTTSVSGLTAPDTGLLTAFSTTITPGCGSSTLVAGCDAAIINAIGTSGVSGVPEPGALSLVGIGVLVIGIMRLRGAGSGRIAA
jgi:hypothetical protein